MCATNPYASTDALTTECTKARQSCDSLQAVITKEKEEERTKAASDNFTNGKRLRGWDKTIKVEESGHKWHIALLSPGMYCDPATWVPSY
jgi:hypothetical protein